MKLTKEHVGKKMRLSGWDVHHFFIPLGQTSSGTWVGENETGSTVANPNFEFQDWKFFEEPAPEIKLWSVWENSEDSNLLFISKIDSGSFEYFFPGGVVTRYCDFTNVKFSFSLVFRPRPDLEVVAPAILEFPNEGLRLSNEYINVEKFLKGKDMYIPFNHFKWPASLALCQIVKKQ